MKSSIFIGTRVEALIALSFFSEIKLIITERNSYIHKSSFINEYQSIFLDDISKEELLKNLFKPKVDMVFSAGFKYILPKYILEQNLFFLNSHPSYLPKYKGRKAISSAFKSNENYIGSTLHFMNENVDSGKIIYQEKIGIRSFNLDQVYKVVFSFLEPCVITKGLNLLLNERSN